MIKVADMMVQTINEIRPIAAARVWAPVDADGLCNKVRVYIGKGYIDLRAENKACIETVGRSDFDAAKKALEVTGYQRVYA